MRSLVGSTPSRFRPDDLALITTALFFCFDLLFGVGTNRTLLSGTVIFWTCFGDIDGSERLKNE
jgi:hypothetical protein